MPIIIFFFKDLKFRLIERHSKNVGISCEKVGQPHTRMNLVLLSLLCMYDYHIKRFEEFIWDKPTVRSFLGYQYSLITALLVI